MDRLKQLVMFAMLPVIFIGYCIIISFVLIMTVIFKIFGVDTFIETRHGIMFNDGSMCEWEDTIFDKILFKELVK